VSCPSSERTPPTIGVVQGESDERDGQPRDRAISSIMTPNTGSPPTLTICQGTPHHPGWLSSTKSPWTTTPRATSSAAASGLADPSPRTITLPITPPLLAKPRWGTAIAIWFGRLPFGMGRKRRPANRQPLLRHRCDSQPGAGKTDDDSPSLSTTPSMPANNLTLNLGLRYEYQSPWSERHNRQIVLRSDRGRSACRQCGSRSRRVDPPPQCSAPSGWSDTPGHTSRYNLDETGLGVATARWFRLLHQSQNRGARRLWIVLDSARRQLGNQSTQRSGQLHSDGLHREQWKACQVPTNTVETPWLNFVAPPGNAAVKNSHRLAADCPTI
jgi:hypothetical protein